MPSRDKVSVLLNAPSEETMLDGSLDITANDFFRNANMGGDH